MQDGIDNRVIPTKQLISNGDIIVRPSNMSLAANRRMLWRVPVVVFNGRLPLISDCFGAQCNCQLGAQVAVKIVNILFALNS